MDLNDEQQKAIDIEVGNVLISAGAGSGKTTVFTNRIVNQIKTGKMDIENFLILTFTNMAANQMKNKIIGLLANRQDLIEKVNNAHIETYDAFALYILKKYGNRIGIDGRIDIVSKDVISVKVNGIVNEELDALYKNPPIEFKKFIHNHFLVPNDDALVGFITAIYEALAFDDNYVETLDNYSKDYLSKDAKTKLQDAYFKVCLATIKSFKESIDSAFLPFGDFNEKVFLAGYQTYLDVESYTDLKNVEKLGNNKYPEEMDGKIKKDIRDLGTVMKNFTNSSNWETFLSNDFLDHSNFMPIICNVAKNVIEKVRAFKIDKGALEFSDVQMQVNKLLKNNPDVIKDLKREFKIIMIDEFQDTNPSEDEFINYFSNNNVYMVGDIKQSIYKFRGADSSIFNKYEKDFKLNPAHGKDIFMNANYRSNKEIIDGVNGIFSKLMNGGMGGVNDYSEHTLLCGNKCNNDPELAETQHGIVVDLCLKGNEYNEIASDIFKRINSKMMICDKIGNKKIVRPCEFKDFAILIDLGTHFNDCVKAFKQKGIPLIVNKDQDITSDRCIMTVSSIFKFLDACSKQNFSFMKQKHMFASIARSFLFNYSDERLYKLLKDESYKEDELFKKLRDFAYSCKYLTLEEAYLKVLNEFNFVERVGDLGNGINCLNILDFLRVKLSEMDSLSYTTNQFVDYLDKIDKLNLKIEGKILDKTDNAVTLETIHKSKGLEYNIVYYPHLDNGDNKDNEAPFIVNKEFGYWLNCIFKGSDDEGAPTIKRVLKAKEAESESNENLRKFYVALTRAKEVAILVKTFRKDKDSSSSEDLEKSKTLKSYRFNAKPSINKPKGFSQFLSETQISFPLNEFMNVKENELDDSSKLKTDFINKSGEIEIRENKVTSDLVEEVHASKANPDIDNDYILRKGTHLHLLMEEVNLLNKDVSFIKNDKERELIRKAINNDLFTDIDKDTKIFKEYQFYDKLNDVTGCVDLLIIYKDKIKIVDYKLKNLDETHYQKQLEVYKDYIEQVFKTVEIECYLLSIEENKSIKVSVKIAASN